MLEALPYGKQFQGAYQSWSLKHLLRQRITIIDQQCWPSKLLGYQFDVVK